MPLIFQRNAPQIPQSGGGGGGNPNIPAGPPGGAFDFFISLTGNDSNNGTSPSTAWALTSLISSSSNQSKIAGKRIGLIAGTYNVAGTTGVAGAIKIGHGSFPTNNSYCALTLPTGPNASTPTYIGSCTSSGVYSQRVAIINVISGQTSTTSNVWYNGLIGSGEDYPNHVYVTIDALTINGNGGTVGGMDGIAAGNEGAHIVFFQTATGSFTGSTGAAPAAILVCNNEISGIQATDNGGNDAGVWLQNINGAIVINNKLHDISKQPSDASHCHAFECYGCQNVHLLYNSVSNCTGGAFEPKEGNSNIEAGYCYIYNTGNSGVGNSAVFQAWDGAEGNPNNPNIGYSIHHCIVDTCGRVTFGESNNANHTMALSWYNNTIFNSAPVVLQASGGGALISYYNNLNVLSTPSSGFQQFTTGGFSVLDYNDTYVLNGSYTGMWQMSGTNYNTLGAFRTATSAESHGFTLDPLFLPGTANIVPGGGSSQFQYQNGSPCSLSGMGGANVGAWDVGVTQIGSSW
jgi:hypothetical protein